MSTLMTATRSGECRTVESVNVDLLDLGSLDLFETEFSSHSKIVRLNNRLSAVLQRSLELREILQIFSTEVFSLVGHTGLEFKSISDGVSEFLGTPNTSRCSYRLIVKGEVLGELNLFNSSSFDDDKLEILETATLSLLYPLQNALLYKQAIVASLTDPLTGVGNRKGLRWHLTREMDLARRFGTQMAVLMIDVDDFKLVNDSFGHAAGDVVLQTVVEEILRQNRRIDLSFRYGGEEFVVLLSTTDIQGAEVIARRIRSSIAGRNICLGDEITTITVSVGITALTEVDSEESLLGRADEALYRAKAAGKNQVTVIP